MHADGHVKFNILRYIQLDTYTWYMSYKLLYIYILDVLVLKIIYARRLFLLPATLYTAAPLQTTTSRSRSGSGKSHSQVKV